MDSCQLIHSSLSYQGPTKKARPVNAVKVRLCFNTVSLHYNYIVTCMIIIHGLVFATPWFLDIRISVC